MNQEIYNIIIKRLSGQISKMDEDRLQHWLSISEDNRHDFEEICDLWNGTKINDSYSNQDRVFDKIIGKIKEDEKVSGPKIKHYKSSGGKTPLIAASTIIILSFAVSLILFLKFNNEDTPEASIEWIKKENPSGQKSKIHLPDGSIAYLNSSSSLKYISDFTDTARDVYLQGEAYFEVAKDKLKPFRVHSSDFTVRALGTEFNVNSYESASVISLVEGEVKVCRHSKSEFLAPGESVIISDNEIQKSDINLRSITAWKDGVLIFKGNTLSEMIVKLERWYGVKVKVTGNPDQNMKYNGEFDNEYLSNVLESMRYGREFDFTIKGKEITLFFH